MVMGVDQEKANGQFEQCAYRPMKAKKIKMDRKRYLGFGDREVIGFDNRAARLVGFSFGEEEKIRWLQQDKSDETQKSPQKKKFSNGTIRDKSKEKSRMIRYNKDVVRYGTINLTYEWEAKPCRSKDHIVFWDNDKKLWTNNDTAEILEELLKWRPEDYKGVEKFALKYGFINYECNSDSKYMPYETFKATYILFDLLNRLKNCISDCSNNEALLDGLKSLMNLICWDGYLLGSEGRVYDDFSRFPFSYTNFKMDWLEEQKQNVGKQNVEIQNEELTEKDYILLYMYITGKLVKEFGKKLGKKRKRKLTKYILLYMYMTRKLAEKCGNKPQCNQDMSDDGVQKKYEQVRVEIQNNEFTEKVYILLNMYTTHILAEKCENKPEGNWDVNGDGVQKEFEQTLIEIRNNKFAEKTYILLYMYLTRILAKECGNKLEDNQHVNDADVLKKYRKVLIEIQNREFTDNAYILLYMYITRVFAEECGNKLQGNQHVNNDNVLKEFKQMLTEIQNEEFTDRDYILVYMYIIRILAKDCRNKLQGDQYVDDDDILKEFKQARELYWRKRKESEGKAEEQKEKILTEDLIEEDVTEQKENDEKALAKDTIQKYGKIIGIELPNNYRSPMEKEKSPLRIERLEAIIYFADLVEKMAGRIYLSKESQENKIFLMEPGVFNDKDKKLIRQLSRFFIQDICNTILRVNSVPRLILDDNNKLRVKETFELDTLGALTRAFMYTSVIEEDKRKCCRCGEPFFGKGDFCSDKCKKKYKRNVKRIRV